MERMKWLNEIELEGDLVRMIPIKESHEEALVKAASDGALWDLWFTSVPSSTTISSYVDFALQEYREDCAQAFVVVCKQTNEVIGTTRYCHATAEHRRLEIGYTWYAKSSQRTGVNTACKYLLLAHAFETLGCNVVEFRTHFHNLASRNAIARLGAKQDGILRSHILGTDGTLRDTVVFSIIKDEWPTVKKSLTYKMKR
jgi:RimJ/RimL family protein N-acetyltransferase